jgi:rhamnosyltransferase
MFFSNVCSVARREVCLRFPFDETLIMSEDQAFAKALLSAGYRTVYAADVQVVHSHHYDLPTLFRRNFDSAYSLRGVAHDSASGQAGRGIRYILGEAAYVLRIGKPWWLAYLPLYEATRIAGRLFGANADRLPRRWRVAFSLHRNYWSREVAV